MQVDLKRPSELTGAEQQAWDQFARDDPSAAGPNFSRSFAEAVEAARPDARVAVARLRGSVVGFLPLHPGLGGHARPLGGPISDLHGLVVRPDVYLDVPGLLAPAHLSAFAFHAAPALQPTFFRAADEHDGVHAVDLSSGFAAYEADRRALKDKAFKNLDRRARKADREIGAPVFQLHDQRPSAWESLTAWKSAQYRAAGHPDVFACDWVLRLFKVLRRGGPDARLVVSSLSFGDRLAAVHAGLAGRGVFQFWFSAYDPALAPYSPGQQLRLEILKAHGALEAAEFHLGRGDYQQKRDLATHQIAVAAGVVGAPSATWLAIRAARAVEEAASRMPLLGTLSAVPGKAFRRIDRFTAFHAP